MSAGGRTSSGQPGRSGLVDGVVAAGVTGLWYAMPDVVPSRGARGALKLGLVVGSLAYAVVTARATTTAGSGPDGGSPAGDRPEAGLARIRALTDRAPVLDGSVIEAVHEGSADDGWGGRGVPWRRVAGLAVGLGAVAASLAATAAVERGIHRLGEHLAARGVRAPHTRIGVVAGLLTAAATVAGERMAPSAQGV